MKSFLTKHGWWVVGVGGFLLWKFDRPHADWIIQNLVDFVDWIYANASGAISKVKEMFFK